MSEALNRVRGIDYLPIFPLPLVMLPNELVPLHIFEEKYRQMLKDIVHSRNVFGISLLEPDGSIIDRPPVGSVGCVAEIRESETLPDGRSNILSLGIVRYRILDYKDAGEPYLVAVPEFFEDDTEDSAQLAPLTETVFKLFERMAAAAFKISGSRGTLPEIQRTDPEPMSFLITAAFNFDNEKKYRLLEMTSTSNRLLHLKEILDHAVSQMEDNAEIHVASRSNGHSKKSIDL
ncbi:MAG: LON peptidase substrate-binding domain-containing protein [Pyrinomonadaceae bacterium]